MKKEVKKVVSLILAFAMMFSGVSVAFASDEAADNIVNAVLKPLANYEECEFSLTVTSGEDILSGSVYANRSVGGPRSTDRKRAEYSGK